jgi:periplasmic protein TonB
MIISTTSPSLDKSFLLEEIFNHKNRIFKSVKIKNSGCGLCGIFSALAGHATVVVIGMSFAAFAAPILVKEPPATDVMVITQEEWAALALRSEPELPMSEPVVDPVALDMPQETTEQAADPDLPMPDVAEPVLIEPKRQRPRTTEPPRELRREAPRVVRQAARPPAALSSAPLGDKPATRTASAPPASYISAVVRKINAARFYPEQARDNGTRGRVILAFSIRRDGSLGNVRITSSSGSPVLDNAARGILMKAAPFAAFSSDVTSLQINVTAPIDFSLR